MLVMVSNQTAWKTHYLQGRYGGLGLLLPPNGLRGPYPHLPWALDNGAFPAWKNNAPWAEDEFLHALDWAAERTVPPRWVVVPDSVGQAQITFDLWHSWHQRIRERGFRCAFACQDGMTPESLVANDVEADVLFIGGTTDWKMGSIRMWTASHPRVHVGRINGLRGLMACHTAGAESTDGTGFFRGRRAQLKELVDYLKEYGRTEEHPLFLPLPANGQGSLFSDETEAS